MAGGASSQDPGKKVLELLDQLVAWRLDGEDSSDRRCKARSRELHGDAGPLGRWRTPWYAFVFESLKHVDASNFLNEVGCGDGGADRGLG